MSTTLAAGVPVKLVFLDIRPVRHFDRARIREAAQLSTCNGIEMIPVHCSLSASGWGCGPAGALCAWSMKRLRLGVKAALQAQCGLYTTMVSPHQAVMWQEDWIGIAKSVDALHKIRPSIEGQTSDQPGVTGRDVI